MKARIWNLTNSFRGQRAIRPKNTKLEVPEKKGWKPDLQTETEMEEDHEAPRRPRGHFCLTTFWRWVCVWMAVLRIKMSASTPQLILYMEEKKGRGVFCFCVSETWRQGWQTMTRQLCVCEIRHVNAGECHFRVTPAASPRVTGTAQSAS